MQPFNEKRETTRHLLEAPIKFNKGVGKTRDFSISGVYFTTKENFQAGDELSFVFNFRYAMPNQNVPINCSAQVVRVEELGSEVGVAAKISHISYVH